MQLFGPTGQNDSERRLLLRSQGPRIDVTLRNSMGNPSVNELSAKYFQSSQNASALIDTGASVNCIDNQIAKQLNLKVIDFRLMRSASDSGLTPVYLGKVEIPKLNETIFGEFYGAELAQSGQNHRLLLGTPFLSSFIFNYDGPKGVFYIGRSTELLKDLPFDE